EIAMQLIVSLGKTREQALERFRESQMYRHLLSLRQSTLREQAGSRPEDFNLVGTAQEVRAQVQALQEAGVTHLCGLYFTAGSVSERVEHMQEFAEEVGGDL